MIPLPRFWTEDVEIPRAGSTSLGFSDTKIAVPVKAGEVTCNPPLACDRETFVAYIKGMKDGERVTVLGRCCEEGMQGTVVIKDHGVCIKLDPYPSGGQMTVSFLGGARRLTDVFPNVPDKAEPPVTDSRRRDSEQAEFERWLEKCCPSGDAESVHRQWRESSEYADSQRETPRTEHQCFDAPESISHQVSQFVDADFARTLERELAAAEAKLIPCSLAEAAKRPAKSISAIHQCDAEACCQMIENLRDELAAAEAKHMESCRAKDQIVNNVNFCNRNMEAQILRLQQTLTAAKKDSERLDWLLAYAAKCDGEMDGEDWFWKTREEIDDAMRASNNDS